MQTDADALRVLGTGTLALAAEIDDGLEDAEAVREGWAGALHAAATASAGQGQEPAEVAAAVLDDLEELFADEGITIPAAAKVAVLARISGGDQ